MLRVTGSADWSLGSLAPCVPSLVRHQLKPTGQNAPLTIWGERLMRARMGVNPTSGASSQDRVQQIKARSAEVG